MGKQDKRLTARVVAVLVLLVSTLTLVLGSRVQAQTTTQTANGFLVSPVRTEVTIQKGQSQVITISVQNPTNIATVAKAVINDFIASDDESGAPRLILDSNTPLPANNFRSLASSIPDISLAAHDRKDVTLTLTVPNNANSGGYYGAVRFVASNNGKQSNVGLTASVGTLVLVTVPGNLTEKLQLVQLSAAQNGSARSVFFSGNVQVLTRIQNVGNIHLQPFGKVNVKDMFGKTVASYEFNNTSPRDNILPNSIRKFTDPLPKRNWFGRYTISENLAYQQGSGNLLLASATFWYFPVWFTVVVFLLIALIVGLIYWVLWSRRGHKHHTSSAPQA